MFDKLSSPVVMICGRNKIETGSKEREKFVSLSHVSLFIGSSFCLLSFFDLFCLWTDDDTPKLWPSCETGM